MPHKKFIGHIFSCFINHSCRLNSFLWHRISVPGTDDIGPCIACRFPFFLMKGSEHRSVGTGLSVVHPNGMRVSMIDFRSSRPLPFHCAGIWCKKRWDRFSRLGACLRESTLPGRRGWSYSPRWPVGASRRRDSAWSGGKMVDFERRFGRLILCWRDQTAKASTPNLFSLRKNGISSFLAIASLLVDRFPLKSDSSKTGCFAYMLNKICAW